MPPSLSKKLLARGCALHVERGHGETVTILTGLDAGKDFIAVVETLQDFNLQEEVGGNDRRARRTIHFISAVPRIGSQELIRTADGKIWYAVANPLNGFLSTDFDLKEKANVDS